MLQLLQNGIKRTNDFFSSLGPSPSSNLRSALLSNDENKCILVYTKDSKGHPIPEPLNPSLPFRGKRHSETTPLHMASLMAFEKLVAIFLTHGGNPNALNARAETSLHAVCGRSDEADKRLKLLEIFLDWFGPAGEAVSINRVDVDGNSAIHMAASNGLRLCVERLIRKGAIISLVNQMQRTCCELADASNHKDLATTIELALVYQPEDETYRAYRQSVDRAPSSSGLSPLSLRCHSYAVSALQGIVDELVLGAASYVQQMCSHLLVSESRAEQLLDRAEWDINKLRAALSSGPEAFFEKCNLSNDIKSMQIYEKLEKSASVTDLGPCSICGEDMRAPLSVTSLADLDRADLTEAQRESAMYSSISCGVGHQFCFSCWSTHLRTQVAEFGAHSLCCPGFKCGETLSQAWARPMLRDDGLVARYLEQRCRHVVDCCSHMRWCPSDGCQLALCWEPDAVAPSKYFDAEVVPQNLTCAAGHGTCLHCDAEAHAPCSCPDWKIWQARVEKELRVLGPVAGANKAVGADKIVADGDEEPGALTRQKSQGDDVANALWVAANTKPCPRCKTPIEKDEGCNHMACRKCRYEFCWICTQDWASHSQQTGGYFQCNKFSADLGAGAVSVEEQDDEKEYLALFPEEAGNAHMEALRNRNRGLRMARFIHHYTRAHAHQDSALMENRLRAGTIKRITQGLLDSWNEPRKWFLDRDGHPFSDAENRSLKEAATGASISWDAKRVETELLSFLHEGFDELQKSRQFLKGSYAFAFYCFGDDTEEQMYQYEQVAELVRNHPSHSSSSRRNLSRTNSSSTAAAAAAEARNAFLQKRKQKLRLHRHMEYRRPDFEQLQSELEFLTETLSDVVARRRLRASMTHIVESTAACRAKRVDFENMLNSWATIDRVSGASGGSSAKSRQKSRHTVVSLGDLAGGAGGLGGGERRNFASAQRFMMVGMEPGEMDENQTGTEGGRMQEIDSLELQELNRVIMLSMQETAGLEASTRSAAAAARDTSRDTAPVSQRHLESGRLSAFVDEDAVKTLTDMGFERTSALSALQHCDGNVERAMDTLLSGST